MDGLPASNIQKILAAEIATRFKQGWQVEAVGESGAVMSRSKPKSNGVLGSLLLAPFSVFVAALWGAASQLDRKYEGLTIQVNPEGSITTQIVDYEQMMAQLAVQQAALANKNPDSK